MTPPLLIVIPDFNGWTQTAQCLRALSAAKVPASQVILVDHGTTATTRQEARGLFPSITLIRGDPEQWWTGSVNRGIEHALRVGCTHVILLNNDSYILPQTIPVLLSHAARHPEAIVAPVQRSVSTGAYLSITPSENLLLGFSTLRGPRTVTEEMRQRQVLPTRLISGGRGALIPVDAFRSIGVFDETNLPHYGADHDFFLRCRKAGIPLLVALDAEVSIDDTRTSIASKPSELSWPEFRDTLTNIRSHRNIRHVRALFKKHYPIPPLYFIGVWLFVARYLLVYFFARIRSPLLAKLNGAGKGAPD